jgi:hypothetical protein
MKSEEERTGIGIMMDKFVTSAQDCTRTDESVCLLFRFGPAFKSTYAVDMWPIWLKFNCAPVPLSGPHTSSLQSRSGASKSSHSSQTWRSPR